MGLFDKVVKKGLGSALGGKVTEVLEQSTGLDLDGDGQVNGTVSAFGSAAQTMTPGEAEARQAVQSRDMNIQPSSETTDTSYFREILNSNFTQYEIRELVPVSEFGGEGRAYDFALYAHGSCVGVVMLVDHNRDNNRAYKGARAAAEAVGVPFINFYTHMPNERNFVVSRITRLAR